MGIGKKIAMGIAGGLQGGAQGLQTGLNLEAQRKQAENQAMFAQAQAERVALEKAEMAEKAEGTARGHLFGIMSNIAKASPEDKKNIAKQFFPRIQELAPKAGWKPFSDENDLLSHVSIKELGDSYQTIYNARLEMPKILAGQVSPEVATGYFTNAKEAMNVQTRYTTDAGELRILEKDRANLDALEKTYLEKYAKKVEGSAPAAILGDKPVSKDTLDVLNKAGGIESTGQLGKDGLPVIGKAVKEVDPSKREGKVFQMTQDLYKRTQVGPLGDLNAMASTAASVRDNVNQFKADPNGYGDFGILMQSLKSLQGDKSVVREAEMTLGKNAGSLIDKAISKYQGVVSGKALSEKQRNEITNVMDVLVESYGRAYAKAARPTYETAKKAGIPLGEVFADPDSIEKYNASNEGKTVKLTKEADDVFSFIGKGK